MAQVLLEGVTKVYPGGVRAVNGVSLTIEDREFVVLVGPSGCGKSTALRMVAGLEEISAGTIRIGGQVVNDVAPKDRDIAMVFQNYALYPHMNVAQNLSFSLRLRRKFGFWRNPAGWIGSGDYRRRSAEEWQEIGRRVADTARVLGIENLLARRPRELSGGQRQRVAVGRAMVREPKAFLFDEPLSNLDAKLRVEMRAEIKRLHRQVQTTTIYVTHDQEEAMTLGDRVVVMKDGVIQQAATPYDVYERPVNRFVAGFVGTPPMNFFEGRLVDSGGRLAFEDGDLRLPLAPEQAGRLARFAGQGVVLGLRPESLHADPGSAGPSGATIRARIVLTEPLGDRTDVHVQTGRYSRVICRVDARTRVKEREMVDLVADMSRAHFFAASAEGENLALP
ncbi:MAG: ATP-binding cassette domain-containing protein [Phycisphaerales bacterium]|nr:ATP-binding cassette domain-containing protein [Phycisphaerales bacterium]